MEQKPVKAQRQIIDFGGGITVDAYQMPDESFRIGIKGAALAVGYAERWLGQLKGKPLETLQGMGFTGSEKTVELDKIKGGGGSAKTISLEDFKKLIRYADRKGKPQAIALIDALLDVSLDDYCRQAFGGEAKNLKERGTMFAISYNETIQCLKEDREDIKIIEDQEDFLGLPEYRL